MARRLRKREHPAPVVLEVPKPTRRARSLDDLEAPAQAAITRTASTYTLRAAELRRLAAHEFITDPDSKSAKHLWDRADRPYRKLVRLATFQDWAVEDNWNTRRQQFWAEVEHKVLVEAGHKILVQRIEELGRLTPASDAMMEYLGPQRDPATGDWKRHPALDAEGKPHPFAGLPILPLVEPGVSIEKFVVSFDKLHKLLMTKRGEVTSRSEDVKRPGEGDSNPLDPTLSGIPFTKDDIRALSRQMLLMRQPELQGEVLEALGAIDAELEAEDQEALEDEEADEHGG